jgi:metal-dependent amidase/aminoacylase/carboxypeptidase family protein
MADHEKDEDAFDGEWDIPSREHPSLSSLLFLLARHSSSVAGAYRGRLHRIPELRWEETKTLALIEKALLHVRAESTARRSDERYATMAEPVRCKGGVYVDIASVSPATGRPDPSLRRLLLRADVDGLPVEEPAGNPGRSTHPGKMHACGHDMHAAMLLAFVRVVMMWLPEKVTELSPEDGPPPFPTALPVNLRCVFQRAEENPVTPSGGYVLCNEDGVLEGVDEVYGLHVWAGLPAGHFYSNPSALLANSDRLRVRISCCGGHASAPHGTRNPIDVAADVVAGLRGFDARTLGPMEPSALVPTISSSGSASNVIPERAELWFGVRNFLPRGRREEWNGQLCQQVRAPREAERVCGRARVRPKRTRGRAHVGGRANLRPSACAAEHMCSRAHVQPRRP